MDFTSLLLDFLCRAWFNIISILRGEFFMAKVTTYSNSKLATCCSFLGYLLIVGGVYFLFNDYAGAGVILLVLSIAFKFLAGFISKKKSEKEAKRNQNV